MWSMATCYSSVVTVYLTASYMQTNRETSEAITGFLGTFPTKLFVFLLLSALKHHVSFQSFCNFKAIEFFTILSFPEPSIVKPSSNAIIARNYKRECCKPSLTFKNKGFVSQELFHTQFYLLFASITSIEMAPVVNEPPFQARNTPVKFFRPHHHRILPWSTIPEVFSILGAGDCLQREFTFTFSKKYLVFESMLTFKNFQTSDVLLFVKKKKKKRRRF